MPGSRAAKLWRSSHDSHYIVQVICPQCSAAAISEETGRCDLCGFTSAANVLVEQRVAEDVREAVQRALGDRHRLRALLRYGEHSFVYLAEQGGPDRMVALKVLPVDGGVGADLAERFQRQAAAVQQLYHPHVLPVYEFGASDSFLWYTMEQVRSPSLADTLREHGPLPTDAVVHLTVQVAAALDYAHGQRVLHGNLKPSNVFFDDARRAVVADFAMLDALRVPATNPGRRRLASPEYTAPEQAGGRPATASADQYALATIVYQCLTGSPPFLGDSPEEMVRRQTTELPPPLDRERPDVPVAMAMAVSRALSRYPAERFLTVRDFAAAVTGGVGGWQPQVPGRTSQPLGVAAPLAPRPRPPVRARRWRRPLVILGILGVLAVGALFARQYVDRGSNTGWSVWTPDPEMLARRPTPPQPREVLPALPPPRDTSPRTFRRPTLPPLTPPAPVEPALLFVNAMPWGRLTVDGTALGDTPKARIALVPGTHRIRVERDGYVPFDTTIAVGAGQEIRLTGIVLREQE